MSRKRITEFTAKKILSPSLNIPFNSISVNSILSKDTLSALPVKKYVIKVDQGIKKRMKKGLVKINVSLNELKDFVQDISKQGYSQFLVEELVEHSPEEEKYLSLERTRGGLIIFYSNKGGIDIEDHKEKIQKTVISNKDTWIDETTKIDEFLSLPKKTVRTVIEVFEQNYFSFLEINPLVIKDGDVHILDLAVEVDSTAGFFFNKAWSSADFVDHFSQKKTEEEKVVAKLAQESQAAFSLEVLNENGSIFVLLSGGGASLVIADEVYNLGYGKELANYGEYSGNPNVEETYLYTKTILSLLLRSNAEKKVLLIGGGVANFTDIRVTFKGVVKALEEYLDELKKQDLHVFVRRGGPHQKEGLEIIAKFLSKSGLRGEVYGPDVVLTKVVKKGIGYVKH